MKVYNTVDLFCGAGVAWRLLDHLKAIRKAAEALMANEKQEATK